MMKNIPVILYISTSLFIHVNARLYNENARLLPWTPHKSSQVGQSVIYNGIGYLADRDHVLIHVIDLNNHHQKTIKGLNGKSLKKGSSTSTTKTSTSTATATTTGPSASSNSQMAHAQLPTCGPNQIGNSRT
jgi:hypothetical protein